MVDFSVFNEKSLPFSSEIDIEKKFILFFILLKELNNKNLDKIRMDEDFKNYSILDNISLQQFFGQLHDNDMKDRLRVFITDGIVKIESPLITDEEIEDNEKSIENEYSYNNQSTFGGLACADIWNTIAISFDSDEEWNKDIILLQKNTIDIDIRHASRVEYLDTHQGFFNEIEEEIKLGITQDNFWIRREEFFPNKLIFCKEVEKQIKNLDKALFNQVIKILKNVENNIKQITDYKSSPESPSVKNNMKKSQDRMFTINNEKVYFDNHLTFSSHKIYFLEQDEKIYIGYIGKHLPTKKF